MLLKSPSPAPEPYASAAIWLLHRVALFMRNEAQSISTQQLRALGEAIHNVPESLTEYGHYFDEQKIREQYLAVYDAKWGTSRDGHGLIRWLDQGIERAREWRSKH